MKGNSREALKKQKRLYIALIGAILLIVCGISYLMCKSEEALPMQAVDIKKNVDLPGNAIDPQAIALSKIETQHQALGARYGFLEEALLETKKNEEQQQKENTELQKQIQKLHQIVSEYKDKPSDIALQQPGKEKYDNFYFSAGEEVSQRAPLKVLAANKRESKLKNVDRVIPAGTTVKAILVSSLDANCGAYSVNDPQPVKLRILDDGRLPKEVTVALKGGLVIGSAYGDISSERAYIRLERMTQVNPGGDFMETEIAGFVSGEDGKYGLRGCVVDRSEKQVKNAALSGFFSGVSQLAQSAIDAKYSYGCCNEGNNRTFDTHILDEAALSGTSSAFDRLSEYYIRRSEQIRPIIQVDAGRIVDITFTHSAEVGDLHIKGKLEEIRNKSREEECARR